MVVRTKSERERKEDKIMKSQGNERRRNERKEEASEIGEKVGQERGRRVQEESGRGPRPAVIYR
jgi:hypothetical protein